MNAIAPPYPRVNQEDVNLAMGTESRTIKVIQSKLLAKHFFTPVTRQKDVSYQFHGLVNEWREDIRFTSSTSKMCSHPAYLRIIGMGEKILPFILRELEREPHHWFVALEAITGNDPVNQEHIGNVKKMAKDWLTWAKGIEYEW